MVKSGEKSVGRDLSENIHNIRILLISLPERPAALAKKGIASRMTSEEIHNKNPGGS